jgi:homocysteine S-methyltransferase
MHLIENLLRTKPTIILDGALATELERRGADLRDSLWSAKILLDQPELIREVHLDYFRSGADCVTTASYQATVEGFAKKGLDQKEALRLIQLSVKLAQEAREQFWTESLERERHNFIAGSVGPYGAYLADGSEYVGNYGLTERELVDFHRPRVKALVEAGVDILACETIPCLSEARALVALLGEFPTTPAWTSFSARDGTHVSEGETFAECVKFLDDFPQIVAVGINCTPPKFIRSLIKAAKAVSDKPILVYPNSGENWDAANRQWYGETSCAAFGEQAQVWYQEGARLIGGCCRTTPEHIRTISEYLASQGP